MSKIIEKLGITKAEQKVFYLQLSNYFYHNPLRVHSKSRFIKLIMQRLFNMFYSEYLSVKELIQKV